MHPSIPSSFEYDVRFYTIPSHPIPFISSLFHLFSLVHLFICSLHHHHHRIHPTRYPFDLATPIRASPRPFSRFPYTLTLVTLVSRSHSHPPRPPWLRVSPVSRPSSYPATLHVSKLIPSRCPHSFLENRGSEHLLPRDSVS